MSDKEITTNVLDKLEEFIPTLVQLKRDIDDVLIEIRLVLTDTIPSTNRTVLGVVTKIVCTYYKVNLNELRSKTRKRELVVPRQVLSVLLKKYTTLSLEDIGTYLHRDHSTIIHSQKVINDAKDTKDRIYTQFTDCETQLLDVLEETNVRLSSQSKNISLERSLREQKSQTEQ